MKIEIVQFYPFVEISKANQIGTLHVFIVDFEIHLRGVRVYYKNNKLHFFTPSMIVTNHKTKLNTRFPIIDFQNKSQKKSFIDEIRKHGSQYIMSTVKLPLPKSNKTLQKNTKFARIDSITTETQSC